MTSQDRRQTSPPIFDRLIQKIKELKDQPGVIEVYHREVEIIAKEIEEIRTKTNSLVAEKEQLDEAASKLPGESGLVAELQQIRLDYTACKGVETQRTAEYTAMVEASKTWISDYKIGFYVDTKEELDMVRQFQELTEILVKVVVPTKEFNQLKELLDGITYRLICDSSEEEINRARYRHHVAYQPEKSSWRSRD